MYETEWTADDTAVLVTILIVGLVVAIIGLIIEIFFLLNLRNLLKQVSPQNQAMSPDLVWLNLIPIFGLGWIIYTVIKVRDSLQYEFQTRGWPVVGDFGYGVGLAYAILALTTWIPYLGYATSLASLVCFVIYWVKTAQLKNQLALAGPAPVTASTPRYPSYGAPGYGSSPQYPSPQYPSGQYPGLGASSGLSTQAKCSACGGVLWPADELCRGCGFVVQPAPTPRGRRLCRRRPRGRRPRQGRSGRRARRNRAARPHRLSEAPPVRSAEAPIAKGAGSARPAGVQLSSATCRGAASAGGGVPQWSPLIKTLSDLSSAMSQVIS
jgi:hypothetical protein